MVAPTGYKGVEVPSVSLPAAARVIASGSCSNFSEAGVLGAALGRARSGAGSGAAGLTGVPREDWGPNTA